MKICKQKDVHKNINFKFHHFLCSQDPLDKQPLIDRANPINRRKLIGSQKDRVPSPALQDLRPELNGQAVCLNFVMVKQVQFRMCL